MNYCGAGTDLKERLDENLKPKKRFLPVDRVDEAALRHDLFYSNHKSAKERIDGDKQMIDELYKIENPTCRERLERAIVVPILSIKRQLVKLYLRIFGDGSAT